ncbi:MAG: hypothetical protein N2561_05450 [Bacteroidetes bacterium]|nr:hypothetical protein [Bacteroidota bacterium]MCX7906967.1 hypothetical protein [Bacteroidota bacterium]MDW8137669.1 hypothetical protein [Bacteroidota bacterium]
MPRLVIGYGVLLSTLLALGCSRTLERAEKVSGLDLPGQLLGAALPAFQGLRFGMSQAEFRDRFPDAIADSLPQFITERLEELSPELRGRFEAALRNRPSASVTLITPPLSVVDKYPYAARLSLDFVHNRLVRVRLLVEARNQTEALAIEYFWLERLSRALKRRFDPEAVTFTAATTAYGLYQWELPGPQRVILQLMPRPGGHPPYVRLLLEDLRLLESASL